MLDRMFGSNIQPSFEHIYSLEEETKRWKHFFQEVTTWRSLQLSYVAGLSKMLGSLKDKQCPINDELRKIITILNHNHQSLVQKINFDVVLVDYQTSNRLLDESYKMIETEKQTCKEMSRVKELLDKSLQKFQSVKKNLFDELASEVLNSDSIDSTMSKKLKRFNKIKELQKQYEDQKSKTSELIQLHQHLEQKSDSLMQKLQKTYQQSLKCRHQTLMKIHLHICSCWKGLDSSLASLTDKIVNFMSQNVVTQFKRKRQLIQKIRISKQGYLQVLLKQISQKQLDEIIEYSKDQQIKSRVKKMVQSNDINPTETDQVSREVQIIKKILKNSEDKTSIDFFKKLIRKNYKCRLNFIFIMQSFRLNGKFLLSEDQLKGLTVIIKDLLDCCDEFKDSYVLKQLMILLMTYYVKPQQGEHKIFIIHFFKNHSLWRDIQFWDSILIQCIYSEKRNTKKMLMSTYEHSTSSDLLEAEKSAILNQVLYVVKNMIIFDFTEKQVKSFANRFGKLLHQDQRELKDIYNTIELAVKDQIVEDQTSLVLEYSSKIFQ